jgi:hypothetical protein
MPRELEPNEVIITDNRISVFGGDVYIERSGKGFYFGLNDIGFHNFPVPFWNFDGNRGFLEWGFFRFGWYPVIGHKDRRKPDATAIQGD